MGTGLETCARSIFNWIEFLNAWFSNEWAQIWRPGPGIFLNWIEFLNAWFSNVWAQVGRPAPGVFLIG